MNTIVRSIVLVSCLWAWAPGTAWSAGQSTRGLLPGDTVDVSVDGTRVDAQVSFLSGVSAEVTIEFQNSSGLTPDSIGLAASEVGILDPGLLQRLPDAALTTLDAAFPLLITVEPPVDQGLSFSGPYTIEIHTELLPYGPGSPYRLFRAPLGGQFEDITEAVLPGSIRTRGRRGGFSEFLVVADLRDTDQVIQTKFDRLEARIQGASLSPGISAQLLTLATLARSKVDADLLDDAQDALQEMIYQVEAASGAGIPDIWRAARDLDNVAGDLIGAASSLQFSITQLP